VRWPSRAASIQPAVQRATAVAPAPPLPAPRPAAPSPPIRWSASPAPPIQCKKRGRKEREKRYHQWLIEREREEQERRDRRRSNRQALDSATERGVRSKNLLSKLAPYLGKENVANLLKGLSELNPQGSYRVLRQLVALHHRFTLDSTNGRIVFRKQGSWPEALQDFRGIGGSLSYSVKTVFGRPVVLTTTIEDVIITVRHASRSSEAHNVNGTIEVHAGREILEFKYMRGGRRQEPTKISEDVVEWSKPKPVNDVDPFEGGLGLGFDEGEL
jgi:hypothetical protein